MSGLRRGDVVWLKFQEIKKIRPGVVVQNDWANKVAPYTIAAAIRGGVGKGLPVQVPVKAGIGGLTKDSVIDCSFLVTVNSEKLKAVGRLPAAMMQMVDEALKISLGL